MPTVRIESNYKVSIPKEARETLGLKVGDEVEAITKKDMVILLRKEAQLERQKRAVRASLKIQGILKGKDSSTLQKLVKEALATPNEIRAIERGRKAYARGEYIPLKDFLRELDTSPHKARPKRLQKRS